MTSTNMKLMEVAIITFNYNILNKKKHPTIH